MEKIKKFTIYFVALNLIVLGADKFFAFFPLACTLMEDASRNLLYGLGVVEIVLGILLFVGKFTRVILVLVFLLMVWAIVMHLINGTYDIGGAIFLAVASAVPLILPKNEISQ